VVALAGSQTVMKAVSAVRCVVRRLVFAIGVPVKRHDVFSRLTRAILFDVEEDIA
jgi:hypothetical protein